VETGLADEGVLPIENSLEGSVPQTLDILVHETKLTIRREVILPIRHHLLTKPGTIITDVKVLFSHPQPLGQCRRFIDRCLPKVEVVAALSTAAAVEDMMAYDGPAAAIGTRRAGELYGAAVLAHDIQDSESNVTKFIVLAAEDHAPTGHDRTSIAFSLQKDRPGVLCDVLQEFAQRSINLAKLESRPSKEKLGRYIFLVELDGHRLDPPVADALRRAQEKSISFKIFGSYPIYENQS
jgi:prephenate dehydratase